MALSLEPERSFSVSRAREIVFDPVTDNLFVIGNSNVIEEITVQGAPVSRFTIDRGMIGMSGSKKVGNILILDESGIIRELTKEGNTVTEDPLFLDHFLDISHLVTTPEGLIYHSGLDRIYIADPGDQNVEDDGVIVEIDLGGNLINTFSTSSLDEGFDRPRGITIDLKNDTDSANDTLLVVDDGNDNLYEMDLSGNLVSIVDIDSQNQPLDNPEGVTVDSINRRLFVVDESNDPDVEPPLSPKVDVFRMELATTASLANFFEVDNGNGIAFEPVTGNVFYIGTADRIFQVEPTGETPSPAPPIINTTLEPAGISASTNGNILVLDEEGIFEELSPTGAPVSGNLFNNSSSLDLSSSNSAVPVSARLLRPRGIVYNTKTDTIFVTDLRVQNQDNDSEIREYSRSGVLRNVISTTSLDPSFTNPQGITFDPDTNSGTLFVVDSSTERIYEIDPASERLLGTVDIGASDVMDPEGITLDPVNDRFFVSDDTTLLVYVFDIGTGLSLIPEGEPIPVNGGKGVLFDQESSDLLVITASDTIEEVSQEGTTIANFIIPNDLVGLSLSTSNNLLVLEESGIVREVSRQGTSTSGNTFETSALNLGTHLSDPRGMTFNTVKNTLFVVDLGTDVDTDDSVILEFNLSGQLINTIQTSAISPNFTKPEGISADPVSAALLVVDDASDRIYEINSVTGGMISNVDIDTEAVVIKDPEGITIENLSDTEGRVFVADDTDLQEKIFTFQVIPDGDSDGLPDAWEVRFLGTLSKDKDDDPDGDGFTNLQEFQNTTDPSANIIRLSPGWNLIAIARMAEDNSVENIFGNQVSGLIWTWDIDRFRIADKLFPQIGYWVYHPENEDMEVRVNLFNPTQSN